VALALDILSWALLVTGGLFCMLGGIGLLRLPDFFSRTHAGGLTDTFGAPCILIGLALQAGDPLVVIKLGLILIFLFFTSPTSSYALGRAAITHGLTPVLHEGEFDDSLREGPIAPDGTAEPLEDEPSV
jgi:multicomponent Na+:H+ antiporter subunit G